LSRKAPEAFRTIAEAAAEVGVAAHVLRFWESQFPFIRPLKRAGGRRFYRPSDIAMLTELRRALHIERLSIKQARALPNRRWHPASAPSAPPVGEAANGGPWAVMRAALGRAIRAKDILDGVLGSSIA
jgi:hypothetical protein